MKLNWGPDHQAEERLHRIDPNLTWELFDVPLSRIDKDWSLHNNARNEHVLNSDIVTEYAVAPSQGCIFPRLVFRKLKGGLFGTLSGNHRTSAVRTLLDMGDLKPDEAVLPGYVLNTTDTMVMDLFSRSINRLGGVRQGKEEAIDHCFFLMETYSLKAAQVAEYFNLKPSVIMDALANKRAKVILAAHGVNTATMAKTAVIKLAQLEYSEGLLRRAGQLAQEFSLSAVRTAQLVDEVKACRSEEAGIKVLARWRDELAAEQKPLPVRESYGLPRARLYQAVTLLFNLLLTGNKGRPFGSLAGMGITDAHDRAELAAKWKEVKKYLDSLLYAARQQ